MITSDLPRAAADDPFGPLSLDDPYPHYRRVREQTPVFWSHYLQSWVLTRYADVKAALMDPRLSSLLTPQAQLRELTPHLREMIEPANEVLSLWLVFQDHAVHKRLRQLFSAAFTPRIIEQMRQRIQARADLLIDAALERGQMDLMADFAVPLPVQVITDLLGTPEGNEELFINWSHAAGMYFGINTLCNEMTIPLLNEATRNMSAYIRAVMDERRRAPQDDLISSLLAVEQQGDRLSELELISNCLLMLHAGHHSTAAMIGSGMFHLLSQPEQRQLLLSQAGLAASAAEETLRCEPAFPRFVRAASVDLELCGQQIRAGQQVNVCVAAANYDPAQFNDPERFDIRRQPNPHLTLGYGPHFCLGAPLARMELAIAFETLLCRLPDLQLVSPRPNWAQAFGLRLLATLPVTFDPALARPATGSAELVSPS